MKATTIDEKNCCRGQTFKCTCRTEGVCRGLPWSESQIRTLWISKNEISDIENKLAAARRFFNSATKELNVATEVFPSNIICYSFQLQTWKQCLNLEISEPLPNNHQRSSSDSMNYTGLQSQIWKNNTRSVLLLLMFSSGFFSFLPGYFFFFNYFQHENYSVELVNRNFLFTIPWITIGVINLVTIAWFSHSAMIKLLRIPDLCREIEQRVYNLVEKPCISAGMNNAGNQHYWGWFSECFLPADWYKKVIQSPFSRGIIDKLKWWRTWGSNWSWTYAFRKQGCKTALSFQ